MSRRRCCCGGSFPNCARCYSVAFTANYVESANTVTTWTTCELDCGDKVPGVGYQQISTKTWHNKLRPIQSHQYLLATDGDAPCFCRMPCQVKTWNPPTSKFECQLTWCVSDAGNVCSSSGPAFVGCASPYVKVKTQTNSGPGNCITCCGTGGIDCGGYQIEFTGTLPDATLSDPACAYSVLVGSGLGTWNATRIRLNYCCRPGTNCCVLDLTRVEIIPAENLGGGDFATADCECIPGTGGVTTVIVGSAPTSVETNVTGFGEVWALAGAPPLSVTCVCC